MKESRRRRLAELVVEMEVMDQDESVYCVLYIFNDNSNRTCLMAFLHVIHMCLKHHVYIYNDQTQATQQVSSAISSQSSSCESENEEDARTSMSISQAIHPSNSPPRNTVDDMVEDIHSYQEPTAIANSLICDDTMREELAASDTVLAANVDTPTFMRHADKSTASLTTTDVPSPANDVNIIYQHLDDSFGDIDDGEGIAY